MTAREAGLLRPLAAWLIPAASALAALLAAGAPLAHHVMGVIALRGAGSAVAESVAEEVAEEVRRRPTLWRYDTIKLVEHLRAYRAQPSVSRVAVVDLDGRAVGAAPQRAEAVLWSHAVVRVQGAPLAAVWVAMDLGPLRARSLGLLGLFSAVAVALGVAVTRGALGTAERAEERISGLLNALRRSAEGLEAQVAERTEALARANDALVAEQRRQRELAARAIAMQEAERRAIARDLHDSVGQSLTAIRLHALVAEADPAALSRVCDTTDHALVELRRALARLGPAALSDAGLGEALGRTLDALEGAAQVTRAIGELGELAPAAEVTAFRIVQEAVTNALRHARSTRLTVCVNRVNHVLRLRVEDDGAGFDPSRAEGGGLRGMRERAELIGGSLTVRSSPGEGTTVTAEVPCDASADVV